MASDYEEKARMRLAERNEVHLQEFYLRNDNGSRWCLAAKPSEAKLAHQGEESIVFWFFRSSM